MKKKLFIILFFSIICFFLTISIKGDKGNPIFYQTQKERDAIIGSPFEATNSTSRYILTETMAENHTFFFTLEEAKFTTPDVSEYKGKFFSLFTPGVSLLGLPFYNIGKLFGIPQLFTYYTVSLFALINVFLIYKIARKLNANIPASLISGFLFLFGTNAYTYALSFTQHHMSTTCILLAILSLFNKNNWKNNLFLGAIIGTAVLLDLPNIILLSPIILFSIIKQLKLTTNQKKITINIPASLLGIILGILPFIFFFGIYNYTTTGSPIKMAQFIGRTSNPKVATIQKTITKEKKSEEKHELPFNSRLLLNGFYILLLSNERSWIYYSPIILFGIGGFILLYKKSETKEISVLILTVLVINILTYAMFADPWGGWSYGARYLIPGASLLAIGIAPLLDKYKKSNLFIIAFLIIATFSIYINTLGAYTTSAIPPKIEAEKLKTPIPYTYEYNENLIETKNFSSSLIYNLYFSSFISIKTYILIITTSLVLCLSGLLYIAKQERNNI